MPPPSVQRSQEKKESLRRLSVYRTDIDAAAIFPRSLQCRSFTGRRRARRRVSNSIKLTVMITQLGMDGDTCHRDCLKRVYGTQAE